MTGRARSSPAPIWPNCGCTATGCSARSRTPRTRCRRRCSRPGAGSGSTRAGPGCGRGCTGSGTNPPSTRAAHLPRGQRAVLLLRDPLGFRSPEVADLLDASEASVNSALQRARATMTAALPARDRDRAPLPRSAREREIAERFATAYADDDVDGVVALLTDNAWFSMPPATLEYQGPAAIASFLTQSARYRGGRRVALVPTRANGQAAFGCYVPDPRARLSPLHGILVLTMEGDRISAITRFIDGALAPHFGLPRALP